MTPEQVLELELQARPWLALGDAIALAPSTPSATLRIDVGHLGGGLYSVAYVTLRAWRERRPGWVWSWRGRDAELSDASGAVRIIIERARP